MYLSKTILESSYVVVEFARIVIFRIIFARLNLSIQEI